LAHVCKHICKHICNHICNHIQVSDWLTMSVSRITPLHHPTIVPPERARIYLRAGADLHVALTPGAPTPLGLAKSLLLAGKVCISPAPPLCLFCAPPTHLKSRSCSRTRRRPARRLTLSSARPSSTAPCWSGPGARRRTRSSPKRSVRRYAFLVT